MNQFEEYKKEFCKTNNKANYLKSVHQKLMEQKDVQYLLKKSIIKEIIIDSQKMYIILNEDFLNLKLCINDIDCEEVPITIFSFGDYENLETEMLNQILSYYKTESNFVVFDIGANIGWYSLNIRKRFENTKVYAFEPSPKSFQRLEDNIKLNKIDKIYTNNIGLFNKNDTVDFYYDEEGSGASSLKDIRERKSVKKINISVKRLDDWADENKVKRVDFIKCDVEGSEFFVYQGGKRIIEESKPIIFSEMLRKWSAKFDYHPNDIINYLSDLGYECYTITSDLKLKQCKLVDEQTVETNYYFLHAQKHNDLIKKFVIK